MISINDVIDAVEARDDIKVVTRLDDIDEYELRGRFSDDETANWLRDQVEQSTHRFDNPARIEAGHAYVRLVPEDN